MNEFIRIRGAKENNLKNIDLDIPKSMLVVLTGLSGSGKSSLAFDTLQKECQRQYMESMGMVTDFISKPKVDMITGLSPSISVDQHLANRSPRSTVGTVTEVFTYLRILFAKLGQRNCPKCGCVIQRAFELEGDNSMELWDGDIESTGMIQDNEETGSETQGKVDEQGTFFPCPQCKTPIPELTMSHFSFNKPEGACPACTGLGVVNKANTDLLVDWDKSIADGGITGWDIHYIKHYSNTLLAAGRHYGFQFDTGTPVRELGQVQKDLLIYGINSPEFQRHFPGINPPGTASKGRFEGVATNVLRRYAERAQDTGYREKMEKVIIQHTCHECKGTRLREESRKVTIQGRTITELSQIALYDLLQWIEGLPEMVSPEGQNIVKPIFDDLKERVKRLVDVGVGYLTMDRSAPSLSGGEAQRLRLASLLGSGLTGVLYVLDEPTTGLHPRDTEKLIKVLKKLRDLGNTVLVIEHDTEMMKSADYIIDMGPGAGRNGGQIVAAGTPADVACCTKSATGRYLAGIDEFEIPDERKKCGGSYLEIKGAREHNLKNVNARIPLGVFTAVTGVSGSGKSTLMFDILDRAARQRFYGAGEAPGEHDEIVGWEFIDRVITIDQTPIGRSTRSNAATYTDVFSYIRNMFSELPDARKAGLQARHFSFNVPGGRCDKCEGAGVLTIKMHFLPEVQVRCPVCHGRRFKRNVLDIKYKGSSISDILNMTIQEALPVFEDVSAVYDRLSFLAEVGLGYLQLGQPATTLSGGEAQRVKLAKELGRRGRGHTLYLLDEPTTGLHPCDVLKLTSLMRRLVDTGNTVIVIEHNPNVISMVDWVIDFGPEGGDEGGTIVAQGTPEEIAAKDTSYTGKYIKHLL